MPIEEVQFGRSPAGRSPAPAPRRALAWTLGSWRLAGTVVAIGLAMFLTWHVINGKHGLSIWHQKRAEDRQLRKEIDELQQENAHLREHVERLKSDPNEIEHEAREKLHYAKPGEIVYTLPEPVQPPPQPVAQPAKTSVLTSAVSLLHDLLQAAAQLFGFDAHR